MSDKPKLTKEEAEIAERRKHPPYEAFGTLPANETTVLRKVRVQLINSFMEWVDAGGWENHLTYRVHPDAEWEAVDDEPEYKVTEVRCTERYIFYTHPSFPNTPNNVTSAPAEKGFDGFIYGAVGDSGDYLKSKIYIGFDTSYTRVQPCIVDRMGEIEYPVAVRWRTER